MKGLLCQCSTRELKTTWWSNQWPLLYSCFPPWCMPMAQQDQYQFVVGDLHQVYSLSSSTFQLGWVGYLKDACVTPIPKGGDSTNPKNYWPISFCLSWESSLNAICMVLLLLAILTVLVPFRTVSGALLLEDFSKKYLCMRQCNWSDK